MVFRLLGFSQVALILFAGSARGEMSRCEQVFASIPQQVLFDRDPARPHLVHGYNVVTADPGYVATMLHDSVPAWSPSGIQKIIEMNRRIGGNLSFQKAGDRRIVFGIDVPHVEGSAIRRVPELFGELSKYQFPRVEIRVEPGDHQTELVLIIGRANGRVEQSLVVVDDNMSHGVGVRVQLPKGENDPVVISASSIKLATLTEPIGAAISLLDMAAEISGFIAPNRILQLRAREGSFIRLPNGSNWQPLN